MRLPRILALMAPLAISAAAVAQPIQGFYVSGGAGLHYTQNTGVTGATSVFGGSHLRLQQDPGFEGLGSVGYALGNGARFEIQGLYDRNNIAALGRIPGQNTTTGTVQHYGAIANALFDMDIGSPWVYPYLGIGAGYVTTNIGSMAVRQQAGTFSYNVSGSQGGLALQAITGLSFPIPNMPGLSITPEYRFMDILGGEKFNGRTGTGTAATVSIDSTIIASDDQRSSASKVLLRISNEVQVACTTRLATGVPQRGCSRPAQPKNRPSRAIAA